MTEDIQEGDKLYSCVFFRARKFWEFWKPEAMTRIGEVSMRATPALIAAGITFDDIRKALEVDLPTIAPAARKTKP